MYMKNLTEDLRLRLSETDMNFLRELSDERNTSISECIRQIIGEYRRSLESLKIISDVLTLAKTKKGELSDGDTITDIDNKL